MSYDDLYAVAQPLRDHACIIRKTIGCITIFPAVAIVLQSLRQVVMKQAGNRVDASREASVHEAVVEVKPGELTMSASTGRHVRVQATEKR